MYDVVVVGGGPAGCHAAALLSRRGLKVVVLEEDPVIGEPVDCSGVIGAESFAELDLPAFLRLGKIDELQLISPSGLEIDFRPLSPLAFIVDRAEFDRSIADRTLKSGVEIRLGTRVVDIHVASDSVDLEVIRQTSNVKGQSGEGRTIDGLLFTNNEARSRVRARVVILAAGPRYRFQERLGMGKPAAFLKTAQVEAPVQGVKTAKVLLGSRVAPSSFAWIVPFWKGSTQFARIGVSSKVSPLPYIKSLLERLRVAGHLDAAPKVHSWVIPTQPLKKTYADRILAVGDAAGQTKPTTGGGIYYGLLSAEAAAETIALAFQKGDFSANTLRLYEQSWRKKVGREMRIGGFFRRLVERLTDQEIDDLFRVVLSDGILTSVARKARFDWHRDVIDFALHHPELGRIFLRGLFR